MKNLLKTITRIPEYLPQEWSMLFDDRTTQFLPFRNLEHFKNEVSKISQIHDDNCDVSYSQASAELISGKPQYDVQQYESIRNKVRAALKKRGLITEEVYEHFKYAVEGTAVGIDIGKYTNGEPDCLITPTKQYVDFFYELYISISYPWEVPNSTITNNMIKLLATIEELERQHIFIKITLVFPDRNPTNSNNLLSIIPLFSHKELKDVGKMSSILNDRLLRKFYFAVLENIYKEDLREGYGFPVKFPDLLDLSEPLNEIDIFIDIQKCVGIQQ